MEPFARSASSSAAILRASGFNSVTTWSVALTSKILAIYAFTRSTLVNSPLSRPVSRDSVVASIRIGYLLVVELHIDWAFFTPNTNEGEKMRVCLKIFIVTERKSECFQILMKIISSYRLRYILTLINI